jgi:hypothetical protein
VDPSIEVWNYKYGYFSIFALAVPLLRRLAIRRFRSGFRDVAMSERYERVDVVAHSFGTHLATWGVLRMAQFRHRRVHTMILASSALPRSFRVERLLVFVGRLVNDCARKDAVLVLGQVLLGVGSAGKRGLIGFEGRRFRNRFYTFGHSGFFQQKGQPTDAFMEKEWVPLLTGDDPLTPPASPRPHSLREEIELALLNVLEPTKYALYMVSASLLVWGLTATTASHWSYVRELRTGHFDAAVALSVSENERFLASSDWGHLAFLWRIKPSRPLAFTRALGLDHQAPVYDVAHSAAGDPEDIPGILAATQRGEIVRWRTEGGRWINSRATLFDIATQIEVSPTGETVLAGGADGRVLRLAGTRQMESPVALTRLPGGVVTLRFDDRGTIFVALSDAGTVTFGAVSGEWSRTCELSDKRFRYGDVKRVREEWIIVAIEIQGSGANERHRAVRWTLPASASDRRSEDCGPSVRSELAQESEQHTPRSVRVTRDGDYVGYYADTTGRGRLDLVTPNGTLSREFVGDVASVTTPTDEGHVYFSSGRRIMRLPHPMGRGASDILSQPMEGKVTTVSWASERDLLVATDAGDLWRWTYDNPPDVERIWSGRPIVHLAAIGSHMAAVGLDDGSLVEITRSETGWRAGAPRRLDIGDIVDVVSCEESDGVWVIGSEGIVHGMQEVLVRDAVPGGVAASVDGAACWTGHTLVITTAASDVLGADSHLEMRRLGKHPGVGTRSIVTDVANRRLVLVDRERRLFLMKPSSHVGQKGWTSAAVDSVYGVAFARGDDLLTVIGGYMLSVRSARDGTAGAYSFGHEFDISAIDSSPDGDHVAIGFGPFVWVYERTASSRISRLVDHIIGF